LFFDIADIIKRTNPKVIFLENVDNLVTHDIGKTFKKIIEVLVNDLDYSIIGVSKNNKGEIIYNPKDFIRNSKDFGVPQKRQLKGFYLRKYQHF
jgi:DNA (cytosine-5)-methyltransferase 1